MIRDLFVERLAMDLFGPGAPDEVINDRPSDRYLTGILFPPRTGLGNDQDEDAEAAGDLESGPGSEAVAGANVTRPSTAGLSFALRPEAGSLPCITVTVTGGRYTGLAEGEDDDESSRAVLAWRRLAVIAIASELILETGTPQEVDLAEHGAPGLSLFLRTTPWRDGFLVTAVVTNTAEISARAGRRAAEEAGFFQTALEIMPACGSRFMGRPVTSSGDDDDGKTASLIYRDATEFATGHVCAAGWDIDADGAGVVRSEWIPRSVVPGVSPLGDEQFHALARPDGRSPLSALWLAEADDEDLAAGLEEVNVAYEKWIEAQTLRLADGGDIPAGFHAIAGDNLERCTAALKRMRKGAALLSSGDPDARLAFRLANRAMLHQRSWTTTAPLSWYPFQLAFVLLALESAANPTSKDRDVMDLLWFPTGGGKTEAYLLLTAFVIFLRRLRATDPAAGGGVTVFMRYTLRLLTIQQFQRAAALICACELLRRDAKAAAPDDDARKLAAGPPVSIGLWVGDGSTPNKRKEAVEALRTDRDSTPRQLTECPACSTRLDWSLSGDGTRIEVRCAKRGCELADRLPRLPVWTVDEDVFAETPSLIIGTADKYAQITRSRASGRLFGLGTGCPPPALIIQDELHLISGPLGTMAGVYEIAVDALCAHGGARAKIIGSTATIRRAKDQIRAVFDRRAFQFPPPGLDHSNSGFAVTDLKSPGRLYLGVTTAGRSAKYTLQAVSASLLQAAAAPNLTAAEVNFYWTLMVYFNSLRELGGSLVLMQDDVAKSIEDFARRRVEPHRPPPEVTELNSRVASRDIPKILERLKIQAGASDVVDVVLASNMISVGMDVQRLGLMVVNGQPKGIAEYIQATSRVGRQATPGLVVTIYNGNKARDRSHYESFTTWHQSLYRDVEATSVTPYAARARDRALHAPLVAMARHLIPGMSAEPLDASPFENELLDLVDAIVERADRSDERESAAVRRYLEKRVDDWMARGAIRYWDEGAPDRSLLMSAEKSAAQAAVRRRPSAAWPTPNSLRNVEASAEFILVRDIGEQER